MRTREEHLTWCRARAFEYLETGDVQNAVTSMLSDLNKHPETQLRSNYLAVYAITIIAAHDLSAARRFIEGFR